MKRSTRILLSVLCTASGVFASVARAEDTLVFAHGVVNSSGKPYSELYKMPDEDRVNSQSKVSSSKYYTPTASAAGFGLWYHARLDHNRGVTQLLRSTSPNALGNVVYEVFGHSIDALALGDFGNGPRLIVGMNALFGGAVVWSFTTSSNPGWEHLYGYDPSREIAALAAADFDGDGDDDIAWGFNFNSGGTVVNVSDFRFSSLQVPLYLPSPYKVTALTGGDYSGSGHADLVSAIRYSSSSYTGCSVWRHQGGTSQKWPIFGWDSSGFVDSMASGDFLGTAQPHDELVVGFVNYVRPANMRYSADGWSLTSYPTVNNLPSSYCYAGSSTCHINSRLLLASFGY